MANLDRNIALHAGWIVSPALGVAIMAAPIYIDLTRQLACITFWSGIAVSLCSSLVLLLLWLRERGLKIKTRAPAIVGCTAIAVACVGMAWLLWPAKPFQKTENLATIAATAPHAASTSTLAVVAPNEKHSSESKRGQVNSSRMNVQSNSAPNQLEQSNPTKTVLVLDDLPIRARSDGQYEMPIILKNESDIDIPYISVDYYQVFLQEKIKDQDIDNYFKSMKSHSDDLMDNIPKVESPDSLPSLSAHRDFQLENPSSRMTKEKFDSVISGKLFLYSFVVVEYIINFDGKLSRYLAEHCSYTDSGSGQFGLCTGHNFSNKAHGRVPHNLTVILLP